MVFGFHTPGASNVRWKKKNGKFFLTDAIVSEDVRTNENAINYGENAFMAAN